MTEIIPHRTLLLAGVRKCGTTTLFAMLANHSEISPASPKESQFFACDGDTVRRNLDWYMNLFEDSSGKTLLDGSTWYFGAEEAPELIQQCIPEARVIICLRDPAERAFSGYLHMKKQTPSKEKRSFNDIISALEKRVNSGEDLLSAETSGLEDAVSRGLSDADYIDESFHKDLFEAPFVTRLSDRRFSFRYFSESTYSHWLPRWEQVFGGRLHIVFFEDLMNQPESLIQEILEFSDLKFEPEAATLLKNNETKLPKSSLAEKILAYRRYNKFGRFTAETLKAMGFTKVGAGFRKKYLYKNKEKASKEDMARARRLLANEYRYWKMRDPRTEKLWVFPDTQGSNL